MKKITILLIATVVFYQVGVTAKTADLKLSGFMDLQHNLEGNNANDGFKWGEIVIRTESKISKKVSVQAGLKYNTTTDTFGLDEALLNINANENIEVGLGQFDIPLGIDYKYYDSPNRALVSQPLLNTKLYNNWNDLGSKVTYTQDNITAVGYVINGKNFQTSGGARAQATGARISLGLEDGEVGLSAANDPTVSDGYVGGDYTYTAGDIEVLTEVLQVNNKNADKAFAYYVQVKYDINEVFLVGRYGKYQEDSSYDRDADTYGTLSRLSLGAGYKIDANAELRVEAQINSEDCRSDHIDNNALLCQATVRF
jgi:hypothetical protein